MKFEQYWDELGRNVNSAEFTDLNGKSISLDEGMQDIVHKIVEANKRGNKVVFIGNGGSASIASHMAIDFWKNAGIKAVCFNDSAQLTCLANDCGYENVFSYPLDMFGQPGDILAAVSSSGKSQNILNSARQAKKKNCFIVTLSGFSAQNPLRKLGNLNIYVPSLSYGIVESLHAVVCHYILDELIQINKNG